MQRTFGTEWVFSSESSSRQAGSSKAEAKSNWKVFIVPFLHNRSSAATKQQRSSDSSRSKKEQQQQQQQAILVLCKGSYISH